MQAGFGPVALSVKLKITLARGEGFAYKRRYRAMAYYVQPLLADAVTNGMALLSVGLVSYLFWLRIREKREERKLQQQRERERRSHWGYV